MAGIEVVGDRWDILVEVARRAKQMLEEKEAAARGQGTNTRARSTSSERKRKRRSDDDGDGERRSTERRKRNIPKNQKKPTNNGPEPPPPLPQAFKKAIREMAHGMQITEEKLVIQKRLFNTDLSKTHNRLSIPLSKVREDFLRADEKSRLSSRNQSHTNHMVVKIITESSLEEEDVKLSKWDMAKSNGRTPFSYVINGTWSRIVERDRLRTGMIVQLWSFRKGGELRFALLTLPENPTQENA